VFEHGLHPVPGLLRLLLMLQVLLHLEDGPAQGVHVFPRLDPLLRPGLGGGRAHQDSTGEKTVVYSMYLHCSKQCFGSGLDQDSIRSVDPYPDPDSESGSESRRG